MGNTVVGRCSFCGYTESVLGKEGTKLNFVQINYPENNILKTNFCNDCTDFKSKYFGDMCDCGTYKIGRHCHNCGGEYVKEYAHILVTNNKNGKTKRFVLTLC